jgi:hypothetical protein
MIQLSQCYVIVKDLVSIVQFENLLSNHIKFSNCLMEFEMIEVV